MMAKHNRLGCTGCDAEHAGCMAIMLAVQQQPYARTPTASEVLIARLPTLAGTGECRKLE